MEDNFQKATEVVVEKCQGWEAAVRGVERQLSRQCEEVLIRSVNGHVPLKQIYIYIYIYKYLYIHMKIKKTELLTLSSSFLQLLFLCPHPSQWGSSERDYTGCTMLTDCILPGKQRGTQNYPAAQQHHHN